MSGINRESTSDKISNKISGYTNGALATPTLLHQTVELATHSIDFAKGVVGLGGSPASSVQDILYNPKGINTFQSLGDLVNETRDLAAHVIEIARDITKYIIVGGVQKVESTANQTGASNVEDGARDIRKSIEQEKPVGYVASARIVVGAIIDRPMEIVQNIVASGVNKVNTPGSTTNGSNKEELSKAASNTANSAKNQPNNTGSFIANSISEIYSKVDPTVQVVNEKTQGIQESAGNIVKTALGVAARQVDKAADRI